MNYIFLIILMLPNVIFGQHFFRIEGDFSVKEKDDQYSQLTVGRFYYDKNINKLTYTVRFPEKQVIVASDTTLFTFKADTVFNRGKNPDINRFSVFYLTLNNKLKNYGLEESFYKLNKVENEDDMVIGTWLPGRRFAKHFGKVMLSSKDNKLHGIVFFDKEDKMIGKQFFEDYITVGGLEFPTKLVRITYRGETKAYQVTTFENIKLNNLHEKRLYDYPLPTH